MCEPHAIHIAIDKSEPWPHCRLQLAYGSWRLGSFSMFEQDSSPFLPAEFILNGIDIEFLEKGRLQLDQIATGCTASLNEFLPLRRDEVAASCGHTFDKFELVYTCRDCAVDETCVLCKDCFVLDDHKTHQYEYYLSPGNGGCCDCGETESWRNSLGCQKHKSTSESAIDDEPLSKPERQVLDNIQRQMSIWTAKYIHWIGTFISGMQQKDSRSNLLLLYNDEFHSFDEVIRCVERTFNHSHQRANNIAHAVDLIVLSELLHFLISDLNLGI